MSATEEQARAIMALVAQGYSLSQIPAGQPPAGQVSNLENPTTRGHMITTCNIICLVIVCIVVTMRMYTRIRIVKSLWWDDWCTLFALACWIGETGLFEKAVSWGAGTHVYDLSVADLYPSLLRGWVVAAVMYSVTMCFSKLSILLLYRRLFPISNFTKRWWVVTGFTVAYSIGGAFASLFQCSPLTSAWSLTVKADYCINTEKFYTANAALNVASDIMILILPIPIVWGLNTDVRKKVILTGLFSMGSISCLVSILRMRSIVVLYQSGFSDMTWGLAEVVIWSQAELTAAMICTCTPCLRPLFEKIVPVLFRSTLGTRKETSGNGYGSNGRYMRTEEYGHKSSASKATSLHDMELESRIMKKITVDVSAVGTDDNDSQKSIIQHR